MADTKDDILTDLLAHLAGAASAYHTYAKRHVSQGRAETDALFSTRVADMDRCVERARAYLKGKEPAQTAARPPELSREHAEWLADKIVNGGDYAKEAAWMLRQWPAANPPELVAKAREFMEPMFRKTVEAITAKATDLPVMLRCKKCGYRGAEAIHERAGGGGVECNYIASPDHSPPALCEDEGCDHHGTDHVCNTPDSTTPGDWFVRKGMQRGIMTDCWVAAPDCNGFAYDAEILGDDEYRDGPEAKSPGLERKLADCELIAKAVNAWRAGNQR